MSPCEFLEFSGGEVGLAISQIISLTYAVQQGMRQAADVENQLMSVERVLEYTLLPPEPNLRDKGIQKPKKKQKQASKEKLLEVPPDWPSYGRIEFKNVLLRYSEDTPLVLKGMSLKIESGEKVLISLYLFGKLRYLINQYLVRLESSEEPVLENLR